MSLKLTNKNYHSVLANTQYMSASQYKDFCQCEAMAFAKSKGEYVMEQSEALIVGSYIDACLLGGFDEFKEEMGERLFTKKGELRSEYKLADVMIERAKRDPLFMRYLKGDTQVIVTGDIAGVPFKAKLDVYHKKGVIVDLKSTKDFSKIWVDGYGKVPFIEAWKYDYQAAIYQWLQDPNALCFIAAITKEKTPDIGLFQIHQERLDYCLSMIGETAPRYYAIKQGVLDPIRCEKCDYCKSTKILKSPILYTEL